MPWLTVLTNVPRAKIPEDFVVKATEIMVAEVKKEAKWMNICLVPDCIMSFGGTTDPCAQVTVASVGHLGPDENRCISKAISAYLETAIGVKPNRFYIQFRDDSPDYTGFNGGTIADLFK